MPSTRPRTELRRYLSLIFYKTYADLRAESERTYVGYLWWVVEPVVSMAVYYVVFSVILSRGGPDYVAFLFAGVVPWRWFQSTVMRGSSAILSSRGLMQQVYLPKLVLPITSFLADTFKFVFVFLLLLGFLFFSGYRFGTAYLALPAVLGTQALLIAALTVLFAGVTPFLPDLKVVLQNVMRLWFFLSGVFYDLDVFSERAQEYLRLNPMAVILESYRAVMIEGRIPDLGALAVFAALSAATLLFAIQLVRKLDYVYPKLKL